MFKYETESNTSITINLFNGYTIEALAKWNNDEKKYYVTLRLRENTVEKWDTIEDAANIEMESDMKTIRRDMAIYVTDLSAKGFFKKYIDRYEFELKCFELGFEMLQKGER